jgi:hypothetical protein
MLPVVVAPMFTCAPIVAGEATLRRMKSPPVV